MSDGNNVLVETKIDSSFQTVLEATEGEKFGCLIYEGKHLSFVRDTARDGAMENGIPSDKIIKIPIIHQGTINNQRERVRVNNTYDRDIESVGKSGSKSYNRELK